jgi:AcrR family transcriptional regulator
MSRARPEGFQRGAKEAADRERIAAAMVRLVSEGGYGATTVPMVLERAGVSREAFDRHFEGKEDCFLQLYDEVAAEFGERVLGAYYKANSWHDRMWAAGWSAMRFLQEDADRTRFFIVEVVHAGVKAQARRDLILQRFAELVDAGRDELEDPKSVSRSTAEIVAGAIYGTILTKIKAGWPDVVGDFLPELMYMAVMPYLGAHTAEEELRVQPLR